MNLKNTCALGALLAVMAPCAASAATVTFLGGASHASGVANTLTISTHAACNAALDMVAVVTITNATSGAATGVTDGATETYVSDKSAAPHFRFTFWSTHNSTLAANAGITGTWPDTTHANYMLAWCVAGLAGGGRYDNAGTAYTGPTAAGSATTVFSDDVIANATEVSLVALVVGGGSADTFSSDGTWGSATGSTTFSTNIARAFNLVVGSNQTLSFAPTNSVIRTFDVQWANYRDVTTGAGGIIGGGVGRMLRR